MTRDQSKRERMRVEIARKLHDRRASGIPWEKVISFPTLTECANEYFAVADIVLEVLWPEIERKCTCDGDPIECGHEVARGVAEEARHQAQATIERVRGHAKRLRTWCGDRDATVDAAGSIVGDLLAELGEAPREEKEDLSSPGGAA